MAPPASNFVSTDQVVANSCLPRQGNSQGTFVVTGNGGLPENPETATIPYQVVQVVPLQTQQAQSSFRFSQASSGQIMLSVGLGAVNIIGALVLGSLLKGGIAAQLGGLVGFVQSIYWILLGYGIGFLAIPLIRYFWIQVKNSQIKARNQKRQEQAIALDRADAALQKKIAYAQQFAAQNVIRQEDLIYTSETDLIAQEIEQSAQIDREWQRRLDSGNGTGERISS